MKVNQAPRAAFADFIAPTPGETPLSRRGQPGAEHGSPGPRQVTALDNREASGALPTVSDLRATRIDLEA